MNNPKHDRQGVRTAADIERKYDFGQIADVGKTIEKQSSEILRIGQDVTQFISTTDRAFDDLKTETNRSVSQAVEAANTATITANSAAAVAGETKQGLAAKVNTTDIVDNLVTADPTKALSANQGVVLKEMIEEIENGVHGEETVGIESVVQTTTSTADNGVNVVTVTKTDGSTSTFEVRNGSKGSKGDPGAGATHAWDGTVLTVTSASGTSSANLKGEPGEDGNPGKDGVSPTVTTSKSGKVTTIKITDASGTKTATINDGADGAAGKSAYQYATEGGYAGTETEFRQKLAKDIPSVAQEAGESESLVMSQKAVTDLVADALGTGGGTAAEYETVDSVDEMADTSKSYVLSTTGTVWAYGETEPKPAYTNLADPNSADWLNGYRINSSGNTVENASAMVTNYIPCKIDDVIRIQGLTFNNNARMYDSSKAGIINTNMTTLLNGGIATQSGDLTTLKAGYETATSKKSNTAYMRFSCAFASGYSAENVIITVNEEIKMSAGYGWYDTGLTPSTGGGGGGNYVDLLVKVTENKANIEELDSRVIALETDADTLTVPSFWQDAVDACIAKIKALQVGRSCVTFPFFSDNHQRNGYAGILIAHIMKECHIPYAFFGGDSIDSGYIASEAVMIEQDKKFDTAMSYIPNGRFCRAVGNHDGYWAVDANNKNFYTDAQNYELFLREESIAQNKHFGGDGTYYYVDDVASQTRFIVLDTNDGTVEAEQIAWFRDTALKVDTGWAVVVISHQPISNHYHANISNAAAVRAVVTESGAEIIGWFSGHIHRDRIYTGAATNTTDDTQGAAMGFTQVTITSDHTGIAYDDATKHTVANDDQSHAIDFVTINKATRTVHLTRLGIGADRSYSY